MMRRTVSASRRLSDVEHIPGPPADRFIGPFGNVYRFHRDPIRYMEQMKTVHGEVVRFCERLRGPVFIFRPLFIGQLLSDPDLCESVGLGLPATPGTAQGRISGGIFKLNGEAHRDFRRSITPAFARAAVEAHAPVMMNHLRARLDTWRPGHTIDLQAEMRRLALESAMPLFGIDSLDRAHQLGDSIEEWLVSSTCPWTKLTQWLPHSAHRRSLWTAKSLEDDLADVLLHAPQSQDKPPTITSILREVCTGRHGDSEPGGPGYLNTIFAAAHDTVASALTWTLLLLAQHPAIARQVEAELETVDLDEPGAITAVEHLDLLNRVVKESLRILSPAVFSSRRIVRDVRLGAMDIPAGTIVTFSHYIAHHDPTTYDRPRSFDPDRWLTTRLSSYEYFPFGSGRRACVGALYGLTVIRMAIAMILSRYHFRLVPGRRIDRAVRITLRSRQGVPVVITLPTEDWKPARLRGTINESVEWG